MHLRPNAPPLRKTTAARSALIVFLAGGSALAALGCGDGGGVGLPPTLSIVLAGSGRGTVVGSTGGLNCTNADGQAPPTGTCEAGVAEGTQVTLAANNAPGSSFAGWSGEGVSCPASAPCTVIVDASRTVTATFETEGASTQVLTVVGGGAETGSGTVVSDPAGIDCAISSGTAAAAGCSAPFPTGTSVQLVETGELVAWGGACSGTTCSTVMSEPRTVIATFAADAPATQLAFVVQPSAVQVGNVITPPVQVALQDDAGQTAAGRTDAVTLELAANPGSATLGGQLTQNAVNGVATFPDLTLNQIGNNYTLTASVSGLPDETSAAFNVNAEPVARLAFTVQPSTVAAGTAITPAVKAEVQDQAGAVLTGRTDEITVSLQTNPGGATLGGTLKATAVAGVATFSNLTLDKSAAGYTLAVSTPNASGATSDQFSIVAGPARLVVRNSLDPQNAPVNTPVGVRPSVKVTDAFNNPVEGVPVTWEVTAGRGTVVASTEDPVVRRTGPLGLSTAVSWTLGPDVGSRNNTLRATVSGDINGSPIIFTASGTIPPGQGIFTGTIWETSNAARLVRRIADARLTFINLTTGTMVGTTESRSDGTFTSPPVAGGNPYGIRVEAADYKAITYQKPILNSGASLSIGDIGMVPFSTEPGSTSLNFKVHLSDEPTVRVTVRVEVYRGYFVGEPDLSLKPDVVEEDNVEIVEEQEVIDNEIDIDIFTSDWGVVTVRITAPNYQPKERFVTLDNPNANRVIPDFVLNPTP